MPDTQYSEQSSESSNSGISFDKYEGKESTQYLCYPQDECKIVFEGSLSDEEYVFPYKGVPVTPDFKVIHVPTGIEISRDCYTYE